MELCGYFIIGGRYNPSTNSWVATSTTGAPAGRTHHTAVWTGSEMIVWGGHAIDSYFNSGGRYNPSTDSWVATSVSGALGGRSLHTAVWTGSEMIVWGGYNGLGSSFNDGGRYNPSTDSWVATSSSGAPTARKSHTAVWTGSEMIVWGGYRRQRLFQQRRPIQSEHGQLGCDQQQRPARWRATFTRQFGRASK